VIELPRTRAVPLCADFSSDDTWQSLQEQILSPTDEGFLAKSSSPRIGAWGAWTRGPSSRQRRRLYPRRYRHPALFFVDAVAIAAPDHPLLVIDLHEDGAPEPFRSVPRGVQAIENNLSIANMDFADLAGAAGADGIFRGF
jgi:Domain of unknown function (DUF6924)